MTSRKIRNSEGRRIEAKPPKLQKKGVDHPTNGVINLSKLNVHNSLDQKNLIKNLPKMGPVTLAFKGPAAHSSKGGYIKLAFANFGPV